MVWPQKSLSSHCDVSLVPGTSSSFSLVTQRAHPTASGRRWWHYLSMSSAACVASSPPLPSPPLALLAPVSPASPARERAANLQSNTPAVKRSISHRSRSGLQWSECPAISWLIKQKSFYNHQMPLLTATFFFRYVEAGVCRVACEASQQEKTGWVKRKRANFFPPPDSPSPQKRKEKKCAWRHVCMRSVSAPPCDRVQILVTEMLNHTASCAYQYPDKHLTLYRVDAPHGSTLVSSQKWLQT